MRPLAALADPATERRAPVNGGSRRPPTRPSLETRGADRFPFRPLPHIYQQKGTLAPIDRARRRAPLRNEDILNSILPPRSHESDGTLWVQNVSATPATRLDVINLQEKLDAQLQARQARETGICPVREELYAQCFDELIRQVTINCAERGSLLLRVSDEARMSIAAYQTLYESSVAFGMRKALGGEQGKSDAEALDRAPRGSRGGSGAAGCRAQGAMRVHREGGRRSEGRRRRRGTRRRSGSCRRAISSSSSSWRSSSAPRRTPSE